MTTIGYATLQLIPSLDGVSKSIDKDLGGVFGKLGPKLGKSFGKDLSKGVGDGLKDAQRDVDKFGDTAKKAFDKAADAAGKLRTAETQLKQIRDSGNEARIVAAEEKVSKARRDSERAARDSTKAQKDHQDALSSLKPDAAASGLSRLADGFKGVAAGAAGFVVGGAVLGLTALATGAIEATRELYKLGAEWDDVSDNLAVKTGATGDGLDGLVKSVQNIAKVTPDSIGTIGDTLAETSRNLHLTGDDLESVTKSVDNLNRMTGEQTNLRSLGKAFRLFSVDAKDQGTALNQLFSVSQKTGLGVNDLIESINKGGLPLKELNLGFGESASLLSQLDDAGLDGETMLVNLRKALANFAKDGKDSRTALQDNVTEIKHLIDTGKEAEAQNLANKIFGAKGGLSFFEAIKGGQLDIANLSASLSGLNSDINATADATADGAEQWQIFKNKVQIALAPVATKIFDLANSGLTDLGDWVDGHQGDMIGFFGGAADAALLFGQVTLKVFGQIVEGFGQIGGGIGNVVGLILKGNAEIKDLFGDSEGAAAARKESEEWFSFGEGLQKQGRDMQSVADAMGNMRSRLGSTVEVMKKAAELTDTLGKSAKDLAVTGENITLNFESNTPEVQKQLADLQIHTEAIANDPTHVRLIADTPEAQRVLDSWFAQQAGRPPVPVKVEPKVDPTAAAQLDTYLKSLSTAVIEPQVKLPTNPFNPPSAPPPASPLPPGGSTQGIPSNPFQIPPPHKAAGGPLIANGPKGKDSALFWGADGEWVSSAPVVDAAGGFTGMAALEKMILHRSIGGPLGGKVALGNISGAGITSQEQQSMWDALRAAFPDAVLSSATRTVQTEGHPDFHNAGRAIDISGPSMDRIAAWIAQNYPDSLELIHAPFGHNIKNGKDVGDGLGLYGAGTMAGHHDHVHWALGHTARGGATVDKPAPFAHHQTQTSAAAPETAAPAASGIGSIPSAFSDLSGFGLDSLGSGVGKTSSGSDLSLFGKAAGAAVSGQVSSALGVFGAGDSPGWLKGLSTLVGGIKVGGGDGSSLSPLSVGRGSTSSAAPIAATTLHHQAPTPDDATPMHGTRAGQAPGSVVNYNIRTATVEDAFLQAQRKQNERIAAKVDRY